MTVKFLSRTESTALKTKLREQYLAETLGKSSEVIDRLVSVIARERMFLEPSEEKLLRDSRELSSSLVRAKIGLLTDR